MEFTALPRMMVFSPLLLLLAGCAPDRGALEVDAFDPHHEQQETLSNHQRLTETELAESTVPAKTEADAIAAPTEKVIWQWLDANIGSQERLAASFTGQRLSGADVGKEIQISSAQNLLFTEQLNLLYAIRKSRNIAIARQYMLVHTLMTIAQAENTQSVLPADDPRRAGVLEQITTARQLLAAIGYDEHLAPQERAGGTGK